MALKNFQFDEIMREYNRRQYRHRHILDQHVQNARQKLPALAQLDSEEADAAVECAAQMIAGDDDASRRLSETLADIADRRKALLRAGGFPEDYLTPTYDCPLCKDTGFDEQGQKCACFLKAATELLYRESNRREQYEAENFDTFSLDYYDRESIDKTGESAYTLAKAALQTAKNYVENFSESPGNLLIYGPTGVGKTFLSNCIARELIESIHSVVHVSAIEFFDLLAAHQFRQEDEADDALYDSMIQCDLLIIDDLGTEIANSFVINSFCQCIDNRLKKRQGTIITTNLELANLQAQYLDRTFSRLISGYTFLRMTGSDIRFQKKHYYHK